MSTHRLRASLLFSGLYTCLAMASLPLAASAEQAHADTRPGQRDACRRTDAPSDTQRIPFELVDGRIYVQARVNGRGPYRFAIDTGASGMGRADASLVSALGLPVQHSASSTSDGVQTASVDTTHFDSLEIGDLMRKDFDVITRDYASRTSADAAFSGIVGRDFFADGLLTIDYPARTLSYSRTAAISPGDGNALAYERAFRVPVSIGDVQLEGNLDTGANVAFVVPESLYAKLPSTVAGESGHSKLTNGEIETRRAIVQGPFRIGALALSDVEVVVSERYPELLVGAHALQDAVLMIDQRSKNVALCNP